MVRGLCLFGIQTLNGLVDFVLCFPDLARNAIAEDFRFGQVFQRCFDLLLIQGQFGWFCHRIFWKTFLSGRFPRIEAFLKECLLLLLIGRDFFQFARRGFPSLGEGVFLDILERVGIIVGFFAFSFATPAFGFGFFHCFHFGEKGQCFELRFHCGRVLPLGDQLSRPFHVLARFGESLHGHIESNGFLVFSHLAVYGGHVQDCVQGGVALGGQCLLFLGDFAIVVRPLGDVSRKVGLVQEKIQFAETELLFFQVDLRA